MDRSATRSDTVTTRHFDDFGSHVESERAVVLMAYVLHLLGSVTVLPSIAALVLSYVKRRDAGDVLASHHDFMIRTFWWALLWVAIGGATTVVLIGWLVLALVWVWYVYRQALGLVRLANGEPMIPPPRR